MIVLFLIYVVCLALFYWSTYKPIKLHNADNDFDVMNYDSRAQWITSLGIAGCYIYLIREQSYFNEIVFSLLAIMVHLPLHLAFRIKKVRQETIVLIIIQIATGIAIIATPDRANYL
ncbi:hypothetical protein [Ekhidna sp.]|uniref:hypothetical protein n=1 Tax=Ekhidna sp. TaxID=2608089 RepID=UPI003CCBCFD8